MRTTRTPQEITSDSLLSLVLLDFCAADSGAVGDRLKATKLLFMATFESARRRLKGLNYSFYRYAHGPFTKELYATWQELSDLGYLYVPSNPRDYITVTEEGKAAASYFLTKMESSATPGIEALKSVFKQVSDTYGSFSTPELLRHIYDMKVVPVGWQEQATIRDIPNGAYFTCILDPKQSLEAVYMSEEITNEFLSKAMRPIRPDRVSDEEYDAIYQSLLNGLMAEKNGEAGTIVSWAELKQKLGVGN